MLWKRLCFLAIGVATSIDRCLWKMMGLILYHCQREVSTLPNDQLVVPAFESNRLYFILRGGREEIEVEFFLLLYVYMYVCVYVCMCTNACSTIDTIPLEIPKDFGLRALLWRLSLAPNEQSAPRACTQYSRIL